MKIAILTSGILPVPAVLGGAVENLIDFYLEYNDQHKLHDITVYSIGNDKTKTHPALKSGVNHYYFIDTTSFIARVKRKFFSMLKKYQGPYHYSVGYYLEQALKHIRRQSYDLIILENRPAYALRVRQITDAKIVYHLHNEKIDYNSDWGNQIYHIASRIVTVSDYISSCIKEDLNHHKCITVHNGIDTAAFSPSRNPVVTRKGLGFDEDDFILVFSGRFHPEKGILQLIEALLTIQPQPKIKLLIIGSPFYGNALLKAESDFVASVKEKASPIIESIKFTGFVPYKAIPDYLQMADVAVIPSVWDDPFPTTVLEAQAMGKPIIASRRGGIPEEVSEDNAILIETDDYFVKHLSEAILDLYHNPEKRKKMAEASCNRARLFDKDTYSRNFFKAINSI